MDCRKLWRFFLMLLKQKASSSDAVSLNLRRVLWKGEERKTKFICCRLSDL